MAAGLDIKSIAAAGTALALRLAGNAKTTAVLHVGQTPTYDPATDTTSGTGGSDITVEGIFYRSIQQQDPAVPGYHASFLFEGAKAPSGIDQADTATIEGAVWQIDGVEPVPTKAAYIIRIRK